MIYFVHNCQFFKNERKSVNKILCLNLEKCSQKCWRWFLRFMVMLHQIQLRAYTWYTLLEDECNSRPITQVYHWKQCSCSILFVTNPAQMLLWIADKLNILKDTVLTILHEDLKNGKICALVVPHFMMAEQKEEHIEACCDCWNGIQWSKFSEIRCH